MLMFGILSLLAINFISIHIVESAVTPCIARDFGKGGTVCVCNETYCDTIEPIGVLEHNVAIVYESSKNGKRLAKSKINFHPLIHNSSETSHEFRILGGKKVTINRKVKYQKIIGFGGAFTDAAGINILSLSSSMAERIIKDYYSHDGLSYTIGRIPIGGSDFSTHKYTYDESPGDLKLVNFSLTSEDTKYKIPLIKIAKNVSENKLKLFGSPWSAPAWMKTNNDIAGKGTLKGEPGGEYYKAWANYFVKFLDAYKSHGLELWGVTGQNEPLDGTITDFPFNCMGFTEITMRDFIKHDLGPALENAGYGPNKLKLMIIDDQRILLNAWANVILADPVASKYVSGIATHWYLDAVTPLSEMDKLHTNFPNYFILSTEACEGSSPFEKEKVTLGDWSRGESYANDIITDLLHHVTGWVDWNLALDLQGGPNWVKNFVDAPIIVNSKAKEYYKQPMFYALGHFSKFLSPESQRIDTKDEGDSNLLTVVFQTPDNATVLIAINKHDNDVPLTIIDNDNNGMLNSNVAAHSFQTFIWRNK